MMKTIVSAFLQLDADVLNQQAVFIRRQHQVRRSPFLFIIISVPIQIHRIVISFCILEFNQGKVEMHNISDKTCLLAIQGPNATKVLQPLTEMDILNMKYYTFSKGLFASAGYHGHPGQLA